MAPLTRMVRATMLEILESDYVKAAWAAGLPRRRVIYGDALRNALIPVITLHGVIFGFLMERLVTQLEIAKIVALLCSAAGVEP